MDISTESNRSKYIETLWLFYAFFLIGFDNGIIGPVLIDLQILVNVSLDTISDVFVASGCGFIAGNILCTVLEKYINFRLFLAISLLAGSVVNIVFPLIGSFVYIMILSFLQGLLKGFIDFAILFICNKIWKEDKGRSFQFVSLGGAISAFIVPFIAEPFLSDQDVSLTGDRHDVPCQNMTLTAENQCTSSNITAVYIIVGILTLPPAVAFFAYYRFYQRQPDVPYEEIDENSIKTSRFAMINKKSVLFLVLLFLFHIPVFGFVLAYGNLLSSYGVKGALGLQKSTMALATSLFWGSFVIGRTFNLILSKYANLTVILIGNFAGLLLGSIALTLTASENTAGLWIGTIIFGIFSSSFLPIVIAWSDRYVTVSGFVISLCLVASGIGEMLIPFIGGILFESEGPESLMILILTVSVLEISLFISLVAVGFTIIDSGVCYSNK